MIYCLVPFESQRVISQLSIVASYRNAWRNHSILTEREFFAPSHSGLGPKNFLRQMLTQTQMRKYV